MEYADYLETGTMPPAILPDESEEERKLKLIARAGGLSVMPPVRSAADATATIPKSPGFSAAAMDAARGGAMPTREASDPDFLQRALTSARPQAGVATPASVTPAQPQSAAPSTSMPPVPLSAPAPRSGAFSGASAKPLMPPLRVPEPVAEPDLGGQKMPPFTPGNLVSGGEAPAAPAPKMPPLPVNPEMQRYQELAAKGAPKPNWWQKALEIAGTFAPFGTAIEQQIPSTPLGYNAELNRAAMRAAKEQQLGKTAGEEQRAAEEFPTQQRLRSAQTREAEARTDELEQGKKDPTDKKIDEYVNGKGQRVLTFQRADNSTYDKVGGQTQPKPAGHTSAFEAFAYGDPQEKKAAQDYLELEKRLGARYRTPSEFDEKFRLFKEDPDTYKAMFGEKPSGGPDKATATKMLNYFDRRRREVQGDFMLDDAQKQEQLKDIENLEKPFLDAVQPGRTDRGAEDRVNVIGPDGTPGTIPRKQLDKAKRKGYREAPTR
jgi:hypothetical protein